MAPTSTKIGRGLAKVLGIKLNYRNETSPDGVTRGESVYSLSSADTYFEAAPTSGEWIRETIPGLRQIRAYVWSLFPFLHWITRYNLQWFIGDMVAGVTVGCVVVPQSMAYAKLALLPVEFGLYSSFMGVLIYWFFATSKDITIGPVAVMSQVTGTVVADAAKSLPNVPGHVIASALAIICGAIVCFLGLARIGWIVELIPLVAISAFMTGSAINIAVGQVPAMMGITGFSTRDATYKVIINILKHLGRTKLDAAMGLTALTMLYLIRFACSQAAKRNPSRAKTFFFISTLRTAFVILLYTAISAGVNLHHKKTPKFAILKTVPRGFQDAAVPTVNKEIIKTFASHLPPSVIVLLIEHISISKSFGRVNHYTINPSQELVAIGVTNLLGPFLGAYPATGSFSRTAIKSKAGVRTPLAGVITAIVVLLAIYALPAVFYYIPSASLSAVIIHAVGDLITPPNTVYQFWKISPLEVPIFFAGVIVTVFTSIENGIYTTICVSFALLLFRTFKAQGRFLGRVKIHSVVGDHILEQDKTGTVTGPRQPQAQAAPESEGTTRSIFLPIDHEDGSNPQVEPESVYPGIFIYRFSEGFNYPNANHYTDKLVETVLRETRRTDPQFYPRLGDRPWNDPGSRHGKGVDDNDTRPTLKAIILDFSSVNNVDVTSVQNLIDVRNQLDRYAAPNTVNWHFAHINNRWTKRALVAAGFGYATPAPNPDVGMIPWKPIFSVADIGGSDSAAAAALAEERHRHQSVSRPANNDIEARASSPSSDERGSLEKNIHQSQAYSHDRKVAVVHGINRPLFHIDLTSALQAAIANVEGKHH